MAQRSRTAKTLAQRIDLSYFKRRHPMRHWKFIVSAAVPAIALMWVAGMAVAGSRTVYSTGPLASAHHVFTDTCERCHVRTAGTLSASVTDRACASCHDAPTHKENQTFTPECASCHAEHRGPVRLAAIEDVSCLQCHADLTAKSVAPVVVRTIGSFAGGGHPAFAVHRNAVRDQAALRFNHAVHMKENLRGASGSVTLSCTTCHKPDANAESGGRDRRRGGLMQPVTFERDCSYCHRLYFDPAIDAQAPHDKTDVIHRFVDAELRRFIAENPQQIGREEPARGRIPVNFPNLPAPEAAHTAAEWVRAREAVVEDYLWTKTCAECHQLTASSEAIVQTVPTAMTTSWLQRARFDHRTHQLATCQSCHANATTSTETADVLVPALQTCQQCHSGTQQAADSRCFVCHDYHDWRKRTATPAGFDLRELGR